MVKLESKRVRVNEPWSKDKPIGQKVLLQCKNPDAHAPADAPLPVAGLFPCVGFLLEVQADLSKAVSFK